MDSTPEHRLKQLLFFRVVMITTLLLIAVYVETVSETLLRVNPLYFVIVGTYGLTLLHIVALRFVRRRSILAFAQVIGDLLIVTGLVYVTGSAGSRAGFMLLYPLSVLSGSVVLYGAAGAVLAGLATLFYAGIVVAVRMGFIPAQGLSDVLTLPATHLVYSIFVTGVACVTVAMIGSYLSHSLRTAGERLEEVSEEIADLRELNQVMVHSIQSGLLTVDGGGRILYANPYGEFILARRLSEIRGQPVHDVLGSILLEASALQAREADARLVRFELLYDRPDGSTLELGVSVTALAKSSMGAGHLLVFQDLTDIKRLEQEVRLNEKLAAMGEMAAQLAHEIRNPLGSISGSAQVLMTESNMSPEQAKLLAIITRESKRLSETLNRFLFQARSGSRPAGPVDVGPLISQAMTLLRNGPEVGPDHHLEFEAENGPHICLADPDQIAQVFWNLARNGLEAMPNGGILKVRLSREDGQLLLSVRDQGRGMRREEQREMFKPFRTKGPMGTGIGLAIVYRIVSEHRGDIRLRSFPMEGTEVEVRLPLLSIPVPA